MPSISFSLKVGSPMTTPFDCIPLSFWRLIWPILLCHSSISVSALGYTCASAFGSSLYLGYVNGVLSSFVSRSDGGVVTRSYFSRIFQSGSTRIFYRSTSSSVSRCETWLASHVCEKACTRVLLHLVHPYIWGTCMACCRRSSVVPLVESLHDCPSSPIVSLMMVLIHDSLSFPIVVPASPRVPMVSVSVSSFGTPMSVCALICLPPIRLEYRDWNGIWSGHCVHCLSPTRMLKMLPSP